jgi:hypothetical protein
MNKKNKRKDSNLWLYISRQIAIIVLTSKLKINNPPQPCAYKSTLNIPKVIEVRHENQRDIFFVENYDNNSEKPCYLEEETII